MRGLLADVNVQGHIPHLRTLLARLDLLPILMEINLLFATFPDVNLPPELDDRSIWKDCQEQGWALFTDNRNHDGPDSLEATLRDSWKNGDLPVITLSNKDRFERDSEYAVRVAITIAELMFGMTEGEYCDQGRIFVPFRAN